MVDLNELKDKVLTKAGICIKCGGDLSSNAAVKNKDQFNTQPEKQICANCKVKIALAKLRGEDPGV